MRLSLLVVSLLFLVIVSAPMAYADAPLAGVENWMYAAADYGFGSVANVQAQFTNYQNAQAIAHNWKANEWDLNYAATVTQFLQKHGCASCSIDGVTLSYKLKIDIGQAAIDYNLPGKPVPD
jgi:hypothetical protein